MTRPDRERDSDVNGHVHFPSYDTRTVPAPTDTVVLLHGLGRSAGSMRPLERRVRAAGFRAVNLGYPSRCHGVEALVERFVRPVVDEARAVSERVHFVTHSLGGILVRALAEHDGLPDGARVVMLAPPNGGSEVADLVRRLLPFQWWCGPALDELGTGDESVPQALGTPDAEVGVIAGDRCLYPWFAPVLGGTNDGLVSLESAKLEGMADFLVVRSGHGFIMRNREAGAQTVHFLQHGCFQRVSP